MPTNFYLHRDPQNCGECGKPGRESEIHIGKWSGGWVFTWQGFDAAQSPSGTALMDPESWLEFLDRETEAGAQIRDEYGQDYSMTRFYEEVEALRGQRRQSVHYPRDAIFQAGPDDVSTGEWF